MTTEWLAASISVLLLVLLLHGMVADYSCVCMRIRGELKWDDGWVGEVRYHSRPSQRSNWQQNVDCFASI